MKKRVFGLAVLVAVGGLDVAVYRGFHLYYRAKDRTPNIDTRVALLERGRRFLLPNDLVLHEAGRAYFESGIGRLQDAAGRDADLEASRDRFLGSLDLNPFSPAAHLDFAQTLRYMNALGLPISESYFDEYKKAARLSGMNRRVFGDIGRIMLGTWAGMNEEDRRFAVEIVKAYLADADAETLESFLQVWALNVSDDGVLAAVLPVRADAYRQAAEFLAEKSLDRGTRLDFLVRAEASDYSAAKDLLRVGQDDFRARRISEAEAGFRRAGEFLDRILFHQNLAARTTIDPLEFRDIRKAVLLGSAKCRLETTRKIEAAASELEAYLSLEDKPGALNELRAFLEERGLIEAKTEASVQDLARLSLELNLAFRQGRYRDIIKTGQALGRGVLVIPEGAKAAYSRILELVGDGYQKLDFIYESNDAYLKAVEAGGDDFGVRLKIRKNFERLNDGAALKAVDAVLARLISPRELVSAEPRLEKGKPLSLPLILRAGPHVLTLTWTDPLADPRLYVSVVANGRILWDDYLVESSLRVVLTADSGKNRVIITSRNGPAAVPKISLVPEPTR
jgi:hypothetical protein